MRAKAAAPVGGIYADYFDDVAGTPIVSRGARPNPYYPSAEQGWSWGMAAGSSAAATRLIASAGTRPSLGVDDLDAIGGFWYRDDIPYASIPDNNQWAESLLTDGTGPYNNTAACDLLVGGDDTAGAYIGYGARWEAANGGQARIYTYSGPGNPNGSEEAGMFSSLAPNGGTRVRMQIFNNGGNPILALWSNYPTKGTVVGTGPTGADYHEWYNENYTSNLSQDYGANKRTGWQQFQFGRQNYRDFVSGSGTETPP